MRCRQRSALDALFPPLVGPAGRCWGCCLHWTASLCMSCLLPRGLPRSSVPSEAVAALGSLASLEFGFGVRGQYSHPAVSLPPGVAWARLVLAVTKRPLRLDPAPLLLQPQAPDRHHLVPTERLAGCEPDHSGLGLHGVRTRRCHRWVPAAPSEPPAPRPLPLPPGPGRVASRVGEAQGRSWRSQPPVSPPDLPGHQPLRKAGAGGSRPTPSVH